MRATGRLGSLYHKNILQVCSRGNISVSLMCHVRDSLSIVSCRNSVPHYPFTMYSAFLFIACTRTPLIFKRATQSNEICVPLLRGTATGGAFSSRPARNPKSTCVEHIRLRRVPTNGRHQAGTSLPPSDDDIHHAPSPDHLPRPDLHGAQVSITARGQNMAPPFNHTDTDTHRETKGVGILHYEGSH